jgi:outer membrane lipopolysaccharide assembly protein LptE/RlpB|tara:strand:+ start:361 stop:822 length:462 start_codon:yes stop_codon:yes gene_type:complete
MQKKIFTYLLLLLLSSCGYEAIYSQKNNINNNFSINELNLIGDRDINLKIKQKLNNYTLIEKDKNFTLKVSSTSKKTIVAKNISGDSTIFKITIIIDVEIIMKDNYTNNMQIVENFTYNNNLDKFDLKKYEREIKRNLAETATNNLISKLSSI